jgi:hypothetical protein
MEYIIPILTFTHVEAGAMSFRPRPLCPRRDVSYWMMGSLDDASFGRYIRPFDDAPTVIYHLQGGRKASGVAQDSASSCCECDYLLPLCGLGSRHSGHGRIVLGTYRPRDAASKGRIVQVTPRIRTTARGHNGRVHIVIAFLMPWTIQYSI